VKGKVVFADGKPVKAMVLTFHPDDEATKSGRLPSVALPDSGEFSFECLPGQYKATVNAIPKGAGTAAEGPGTAPAPPAPPGSKGPPPKDPKSILLAAHATPGSSPLVVQVPAGGVSDLVLTVK
jgi:hypothetical protein